MAKKDKYEYDEYEARRAWLPGESNLTGKSAGSAQAAYQQGKRARLGDEIAEFEDAVARQGEFAVPAAKQPEAAPKSGGGSGGAWTGAWTSAPEPPAAQPRETERFDYGPAPEYVSPYQAQIDEALRAYLDRPAFAWTPETDPSYAAYRKQYAREGRRATEDTLGRYASLTGGMPSTAAVTAAQQAGDYYAAQMADKIPELYDAAYGRYADEGERLLKGLGALRGVEGDAFDRYRTRLGQYNADRAYDTSLWRYGVEDEFEAEKQALERAKLAAKTAR